MKLGFREDKRAVSALVGAILLLAILIIALSSYQAFIVPNQNAETEFDHNQQVEDEMVEFRNALLEARLDNRERAVSVKLGTRYQSRTIAVNPPPATGTLQSVPQDNMSVSGESLGGSDVSFELIGNQFFEYNPSYSEYRDAGTIRYENTLVYHQFSSANVSLSNQRLVRGDTITLIPTEPDLDENGIDRVTYEPQPTQFRVVNLEDPEISVPTELSQEDWEDLLEGQEYESLEVSNGELTLEFDGQKRIVYSIVDDQDLVDIPDDEREEDEEADPETEINPAGPDDIILLNSEFDGDDVTLTFRNLAGETSFTEGRIPFYFNGPGGPSTEEAERVEMVDADGNTIGGSPRGQNWTVSGDFKDLSPSIQVDGDGALTRIRLEFDGDVRANQDFFVLTLGLETGERSTYFVAEGGSADIEEENNNGGNENNGDSSNTFDGTLTAEVTQEGGPNEEWIVTMTYDGSDEISVTADPSNRDSQSGTIGSGQESIDLNLGESNANQIYPITVSGTDGDQNSCENTLNSGDGEISVCQ